MNATPASDVWPAAFHYREGQTVLRRRAVSAPNGTIPEFLRTEFSFGIPTNVLVYEFAGHQGPATPLHFHVAMGCELAVAERMDLHLIWDYGRRKLFVKPLPRYILDEATWNVHLKCPAGCDCANKQRSPFRVLFSGQRPPGPDMCKRDLREVALGYLYTYACLVASESDFHIANEKRLLPRKLQLDGDDKPLAWAQWKTFVSQILDAHDRRIVHPRFYYGELRLSRSGIFFGFVSNTAFKPYSHGWRAYRGLYHWMAATAVFVALVLTAMQVGLVTNQLKDNQDFHNAAYGFTLFSIFGPLAFLIVVWNMVYLNTIWELLWTCVRFLVFLRDRRAGAKSTAAAVHMDDSAPPPPEPKAPAAALTSGLSVAEGHLPTASDAGQMV